MKHTYHIKMHVVLWAAFGMLCFAFVLASPSAWAQSGCFIDDDIGARMCPVGPDPGDDRDVGGYDESRPSERDQENAERIDKANKLLVEAKAAANGNDAREALRLAREAQAMANDYKWLKKWIQQLEDHIVQEGVWKAADTARVEGNASYDRGDWQAALVLYRRALATDPDSLNDIGKERVKDLEERLKSETDAAARERRHRPKVERLRAEAKAMLDVNPADALAKLDAALKLLPDDSKTVGDRWLAQASLALHEERYDAAFEALQKTEGYDLDAAEVARWNSRVKEERQRQGANVQNAFGDLRKRLEATPGVTDPGAQLVSIEHSSRKALSSPVAETEFMTPGKADRKMAGDGFDRPGENRGTLDYPDIKQQQIPPTALEAHVPKEAKDNELIKQSLAWYRQLDGQKAETTQKIAVVEQQLKNGTGDAVVLTAHLGTLKNQMGQIDHNQFKATESVKKEMKNLSLDWIENATPEAPKTLTGKGSNSSLAAQPTLEFIK